MLYYGINKSIPQDIYNTAIAERRSLLASNADQPREEAVKSRCGESARSLVRRLRLIGYRAKFIGGRFAVTDDFYWQCVHCWVLCNNMIIDVTCDQFNPLLRRHKENVRIRPIVFGHKNKLKRYVSN